MIDDVMERRMPEGEVAIRLAEHLLGLHGADPHAEVAIDGASVMAHGAVVFDLAAHMEAQGWVAVDVSTGRNPWTCTYGREGRTIRVHSRSGVGDVVARVGGRRIVAECKKGAAPGKPGSPERPLLTSAIGQALLLAVEPDDLVVAAVPDTLVFRRLADAWRTRPLVARSGIQIALVGRDGMVSGLTSLQVRTGSME